ncbi:hypothetical protein, partial [Neisseria weixii]|uniref:hypothetical protein n=1 Tax=Neisseria weixii TaxID=1853276 RepID=UPI0035A0C385
FGALFDGKLFAVGLFDCSIDRRIFDARAERILIPELHSPDLNQIEKKWAWIKGVRNRLRITDVDRLF